MNKPALTFIALGVAVLAGLFVWLRPDDPATPASATSRVPAAEEAATAPEFEIHRFRVEEGARVAGPAVIEIGAGDAVTLMVTSDRADELHVHGYDLHADLRPGEAATLSFKAEHAGRFEIELHGAHLGLATLEVRPR